MCHARTGPGAEAHHHLPAGRQPSFQLVAALHPRREQRRRQDPSPAHVSPRQSPLGAVRPVWFGLQCLAVLESTVARPTVGLLQGLQLGKCCEPHSGVGLQWGLWELGLGVGGHPASGRCPPGAWPHISTCPDLGGAAAEEIKPPREQGCARACQNQRTLYSPGNADVPPSLPDQELSWGRAGCCPSWHELCPWAGLQAASGGERAGGVDQGQLLESA